MSENHSPEIPAPQPVVTQSSPSPAASDATISIDEFAKVMLRVARIEAAEAVPKSKKLLRLQLDVGPLGKRQILSGIALHYSPESLVGRKIVLVANLKPAVLMGIESQGMLLAASSPDQSTLVLIDPGQTLPEGSEVR
ncbi:MAG: methionine--tRNA ligase subunit beta [Bdellovibrionota bacterium]|nr:MAG: methionine--tRNA ligase subunit beta [Bdellovibrionota bacterium]